MIVDQNKVSVLKVLTDLFSESYDTREVLALNLPDDKILDNMMRPTAAGGYMGFDKSLKTLDVLGTATGIARVAFMEGQDLNIAIETFNISVTKSGTVTHLLVGGTWPILLDVGTDVQLLGGSEVEAGAFIACPRVVLTLTNLS